MMLKLLGWKQKGLHEALLKGKLYSSCPTRRNATVISELIKRALHRDVESAEKSRFEDFA